MSRQRTTQSSNLSKFFFRVPSPVLYVPFRVTFLCDGSLLAVLLTFVGLKRLCEVPKRGSFVFASLVCDISEHRLQAHECGFEPQRNPVMPITAMSAVSGWAAPRAVMDKEMGLAGMRGWQGGLSALWRGCRDGSWDDCRIIFEEVQDIGTHLAVKWYTTH